MATELKYRNLIRNFTWSDLRELWTAIQNRDTPEWEVGKALEYLVIRAFELDGSEVKYPYSVEINEQTVEQIDGVVHADFLSCLVECKDRDTEKTNVEPIYKLRNQLLRRPAGVIGSVFSRTGFTEAAITLASFTMPQTILLWEGSEIEFVLEKERISRELIKKFRHCVETGIPNYNITLARYE